MWACGLPCKFDYRRLTILYSTVSESMNERRRGTTLISTIHYRDTPSQLTLFTPPKTDRVMAAWWLVHWQIWYREQSTSRFSLYWTSTPSPDWNCQWGPSEAHIAYTRAMSEHRCFPKKRLSTHTMHFKWHHINLSKMTMSHWKENESWIIISCYTSILTAAVVCSATTIGGQARDSRDKSECDSAVCSSLHGTQHRIAIWSFSIF